jgi:hypothetical protein
LIPGITIATTQGAIGPALIIAAISVPIVGLIIPFTGSIRLNYSEVVKKCKSNVGSGVIVLAVAVGFVRRRQ